MAPMAGKKADIASTIYSRLHPNGVPNCNLATSSPATRTSTQVHQHCQGHGNAGAPMAGKKADIASTSYSKVPNCNLATSSPATRTSTQVHQHCHFLGNAGAPMAGKKAGIVSTSYSRLHPNGVPNCTLATSSPATRTSTQVHQHCQGHGNAGAPMAGKKADILLPLATAVCTDC